MTDNGPVSRRDLLRGAIGTAAIAAGSGVAAAQDAGSSLEIALVDFAYEPGTDEPARITPGTTVTFVWETPNHNINVDSQPEGADWAGHEPIEGTGFEISHTFEVEGTYEFHCDPHEGLGMVGTIEVSEDAGGGGEPAAPPIPEAAKSLGVGLFGAMLATLGLVYLLLTYGDDPEDAIE